MRLFLDTSVLLAACGSVTGASRLVCVAARSNQWELIVTPYVVEEARRNLAHLAPGAAAAWRDIESALLVRPDVFTINRPSFVGPAKDRPILFGALAWADVLLTLDRADFGGLLDQTFYGLRVLKPGTFLREERTAGRLG